MIFSLLLLFAQSGLELPPLGYFPARDGRLYPLYGMRGNLVIGTPLEEGVTAAIRMDRTMVTKTAAGIVVGLNVAGQHGDAVTRREAGQRPLEQRRLAGARRADEIQAQDLTLLEAPA